MSDERFGEEVRSAVARQTDGLETRPDEDDLVARIGRRSTRKQRALATAAVFMLAVGALGGYLIGNSGGGDDLAIVTPRDTAPGDGSSGSSSFSSVTPSRLDHVFTRAANGIAIRVYALVPSGPVPPGGPTNIMGEFSNDAATGFGSLFVCGDAPLSRVGGRFGVGEGSPFGWVMVRLRGVAADATLVRADFGTSHDEMNPVNGIAALAGSVDTQSTDGPLEGALEAVDANGTVLATLPLDEVMEPPDCSSAEDSTPPVTTPTTLPPTGTVSADSVEQEITYAFQHFFDTTLSADERLALIQGGEQLRAFEERAMARHRSEAAAGAIAVDSIVVSGDQATVQFHAFYAGSESPVNPGQLSGTAVFEGGRWKISRATYCQLSANDGEPCPAG